MLACLFVWVWLSKDAVELFWTVLLAARGSGKPPRIYLLRQGELHDVPVFVARRRHSLVLLNLLDNLLDYLPDLDFVCFLMLVDLASR